MDVVLRRPWGLLSSGASPAEMPRLLGAWAVPVPVPGLLGTEGLPGPGWVVLGPGAGSWVPAPSSERSRVGALGSDRAAFSPFSVLCPCDLGQGACDVSGPHFHHLCNGAFSSVQFSSIVSNSLRPPGLQHARISCPSPTPRAYSDSCPLSRLCHPAISPSVVPFTSCLQSFPASGSFQMSQFVESGSQSIGVSASASVLPMNVQD